MSLVDQTFRKVRWRTTGSGLPFPRLGLRLTDRWLAVVMVAPALLVMAAYVVYPLISVVSNSFHAWNFSSLTGPGQWVGLDNFRAILAGPDFMPNFRRSIYFTAGNVITQTTFGFAIALLLHAQLPGRNIARGSIFFPFIVPVVVAALIWQFMFNDLTGVINYLLQSSHIIDKPLGWLSSPKAAMNTVILVSTWKALPFMIILFLARLQSVPDDLIEAAHIDGCNSFQLLWYIVLPWLWPVIVVAVLLRTIWSLNEFDMPYLLTQGGPNGSTTVLPVYIRELLIDNLDLGRAAAVSVIMLVLLLVLGLLYGLIYRQTEHSLET